MKVKFKLYSEVKSWEAEVHNEKEMELLDKCITNAFKLYDVLRTE